MELSFENSSYFFKVNNLLEDTEGLDHLMYRRHNSFTCVTLYCYACTNCGRLFVVKIVDSGYANFQTAQESFKRLDRDQDGRLNKVSTV